MLKPNSDLSNIETPSSDGDAINRMASIESAPDLSDPFDPANLRIDQEYLKQGAAKKLLTTVPVKKPNKQDFIRVHPSSDYRTNTALIELREERETYIVHPAYVQRLDPSLWSLYTLYLTINRQKTVFLWPVKLPGPDGRLTNWHISAIEAAERAMKDWIRVAANMALGAYETSVAENQYVEPEWPELPFRELLKMGFKGRLIDGPDHPVMQKLRGAI